MIAWKACFLALASRVIQCHLPCSFCLVYAIQPCLAAKGYFINACLCIIIFEGGLLLSAFIVHVLYSVKASFSLYKCTDQQVCQDKITPDNANVEQLILVKQPFGCFLKKKKKIWLSKGNLFTYVSKYAITIYYIFFFHEAKPHLFELFSCQLSQPKPNLRKELFMK